MCAKSVVFANFSDLNIMKKYIFSLFLSASAVFSAMATIKPFDLRVGEFFSNPLGYSLEDLSFSWKLPDVQGMGQTAYRIQVSSDFSNPSAILWDSGKVESSDSVKVKVPLEVKPRGKYFWRLKFWDAEGAESEWSDIAFFEAGLLSNSDWNGAMWLSSPRKPIVQRRDVSFQGRDYTVDLMRLKPAYLRRNFELPEDVKKARLYVASRGIFQAHVNGKRVGDDVWGTGWTDYEKRVQVNTYDISKLLSEGANAIGFQLADGWRCGMQAWYYALKGNKKAPPNYKPDIIAVLEIELENGETVRIPTDGKWRFSEGCLIEADIYDGETYDARALPANWSDRDFDISSWEAPACEALGALPLLEARRNEPIRQTAALVPVSKRKIGSGSWIFDFSQNLAGSIELNMPSMPSGTTLKIRYAEMLNSDGTLYTENYRAAKSTDYYISDGKPAKWTPYFTYHGFRYVELSGLPESFEPGEDFIRALQWNSDGEPAGSFFCSAEKINKLQHNIQWGQRGNFFDTPTDCPQRDERMGFLGDAQVFIPTALFNMGLNGFFSKWNVDISDAQSPEGVYPYFAPNPPGYAVLCSGWSDCGVICPWEVYVEYADLKILRRHYPNMKKWIEAQRKVAKNFIMPDSGIGDWLQPNPKDKTKKHGETIRPDTSNDLISTAYFARTTALMARIAKVLGKDSDAAEYEKLAGNIKAAFVKRFIKPDGEVFGDSQSAYLFPLAWDFIADKSLEKKCFERLLKCLERDNFHLNTGFLGTPLLNPVLTKFGRSDIAYRLLFNETYPSWIYSINQGATTMWERWNSYSHDAGFGNAAMNSFNHYAYGSIGQWLYSSVGGISSDIDAPGWKNVIFKAVPNSKLSFAQASHKTPYGIASSEWKIDGPKMFWKIKIPPNATGTVIFPAKSPDKVLFNGERPNSLRLDKVPSGEHTAEITL